MTNRLTYPLSLYVVWHPNFQQGKMIANNLYSIFCREISQPLSRGLNIPVYYRTVVDNETMMPIPINPANAKRNAIVLLVDQNYFVDPNFRIYTENISKLIDENTRVYPIALCEQAYDIGQGLSSFQFIRAYKGELSFKENFDFAMKQVKTSLLHDTARLLMNFQPTWKDTTQNNIPSPVKLFLSHAKKDGLITTKKFKAFVDANLKLDVFFDTIDIADGYEFEQQIEDNIKSSALVVFHTDEYSSREWCRIEVLVAKRNKCSIVVVNDVKNGEKRAFPYLGNTPTITMQVEEEQSFYDIVNLTLYQVINNLYQIELLNSFSELNKMKNVEFITISSPPELFNFIDIYKTKTEGDEKIVVLYPEPPLGVEELRILNEIDKDILFITPVNIPTL